MNLDTTEAKIIKDFLAETIDALSFKRFFDEDLDKLREKADDILLHIFNQSTLDREDRDEQR